MIALEFNEIITIDAPSTVVWQAITSPDIVSKYFFTPLKQIQLKEGGTITYGTKDDDLIYGKVLIAEPTKHLRHTFRFGSTFVEDTQDDPETIVDYRISETDKGITLTLTHFGFTAENQTYANISGGWPFILHGLKSLLEDRSVE